MAGFQERPSAYCEEQKMKTTKNRESIIGFFEKRFDSNKIASITGKLIQTLSLTERKVCAL